MPKKIFLSIFAVVIIAQAAISVAVMSWLNFMIKVERVDYFIERSSRNDILVDNQNQLWASYISHIDVYQNGELVRKFTRDEIGSAPRMLVLSPQGDVWNIDRSLTSLSVFDGQTWTVISGVEDQFVSDAVVDRQGRVWLAASSAVLLYENGQWKEFNTSNSNIRSDTARAIIVDANDRIWVGTVKGVTYFDGQSWQIPPNAPAISVYSLAFAPNGDLWVGSFSDGLFHFDGTTWTRYPVKKDPNNTEQYEAVEEILADKYGRVWVHVATDQFYIFDGKSTQYLGGGPTIQVWNMLIASDGLVYIDTSTNVYIISQDTRLLDNSELSIKKLYDDGFILVTTLFLSSVWILTALNAWGIGAGIALGFATYVIFAFFKIYGYLNPGFTTTLTAFVGGIIGYFVKKSESQRSTVIGSLVGYFAGVVIVVCLVGALTLYIVIRGA